jgi:hypothetical protein
MKIKNKMIPALCLLSLASCGGSNESSNGPSIQQREEQLSEGSYKAILRPYNFTVAGWIPNGMADIRIQDDEIEVKSWLDDSANVVHMQNIHLGTECPTMAHDANNDGFVDFNETTKVAKKILIPLDADLNSQVSGNSIYPKGNFTYFQKASLSELMDDLRLKDENPNDYQVKLAANEPLNLAGRVIIITGSANKNLPSSVSNLNGMTADLSIPIACGKIERMSE